MLGPYLGRKLATNSFSGGPPNYEAHGGTSFATPAVAGLAALLIANYPFDLKQQPEAVRAVLMASAQAHPVRSEGKTIPDFNDTIDDKMGAGAPNGTRAKKIMDEHTLRYGSFLPQLTVSLGLDFITFPAAANEQIRVREQIANTALLKITSPQIQTALTPAPHKGFPRFPQTSTGQQ